MTSENKKALAKAILGTSDITADEQSTSRVVKDENFGGLVIGRLVSANFSGSFEALLDGESVFSVNTNPTQSTDFVDSGIIAFDEIKLEENESSNGLFLRDSIVATVNQ